MPPLAEVVAPGAVLVKIASGSRDWSGDLFHAARRGASRTNRADPRTWSPSLWRCRWSIETAFRLP
jgi:hypothetical protein